jgi:uncharacterized protein (DUF305 family)
MKLITLSTATAVALTLVTGVLAGAAFAQHNHHPGAPQGSPSDQMHHIMMAPMKNMKMTGDADRDFASMMIHHHEQAVKMSQIEVKHGKSVELKALAKKMIVAQTKEIAVLKKHAKMRH